MNRAAGTYIAGCTAAGRNLLNTAFNPPILNAPAAVRWLAGVTILLHVVRVLLPEELGIAFVEQFAFETGQLIDADPAAWMALLMTSVSHLFLHADISHLVMNVAFLLAFGSPVGHRMGPLHLTLFYFLCGAIAAFFWSWLFPDRHAILLGASGAISGMLGAVARLSLWPPRGPDTAMPFLKRSTVISFVVIWLLLTVAFGLYPFFLADDVGGVAWQAHIGGFIAGFLLVGLFDGRGRRQPVAPPIETM